MLSLSGGDLNPVLSAIKLTSQDKIIAIKEIGIADSNFIITHIIKKIFQNNEKLVLVALHHALPHYQIIGKKLGYDFSKKTSCGDATVIEGMKLIENCITDDDYNYLENKEKILTNLFADIKESLETILKLNPNQPVHLVIDDLSHLLDLGINIEYVIRFMTWCINLFQETVKVVISSHVSFYETDEFDLLPKDVILSNALSYIADLNIEVGPLKTGRSNDVSGIINIQRRDETVTKYHYKAYDRGIKTFRPGEALKNE